jgi:Na+/H+-dicarboxylate symporter
MTGDMFSPDPNAGGNKLDDIDGTGGLVQDADPNQKTTLDTFLDLGFTVFPGNLFMALGGSGTPNVLATIVFCLIFAVCLSKQQNNQAAIDFFNCLANSFMSMITFFVKFTPIGIFSLIVKQVATQEDILSMFSSLGMFMVTVVAGLFLQVCMRAGEPL